MLWQDYLSPFLNQWTKSYDVTIQMDFFDRMFAYSNIYFFGFYKKKFDLFCEFFLSDFFGVRGLKGLKKIGNLLYQCLIYNPSLKKNRTKEKNQWYSFLNYRTHYTILRISRSIKYNSIVKLSKLILPYLFLK